jgi:tetratricopeptide (TPR) repeat protein
MAIEGPLRELGVHDVFQLLDLTRKTGALRVRSALRDNDGVVHFRNGRIVGASMRDETHRLGRMLVQGGRITEEELLIALRMQGREGHSRRIGEILLATGAISKRELDRQVRRQVEAVVFELLSWSEGYFSFEEGVPDESPADDQSGLTAEALLMEAARRIDEWARMADRIPHAGVVPVLADTQDDHAASLDLRPQEWQVLAAVDGVGSVRVIAAAVGVSEFDAARVIYGLLTTGVVGLVSVAAPLEPDALVHLSDARDASREGRWMDVIAASERAIHQAPGIAEAHALAGQALFDLNRLDDADRCLRQALELEPRPEWMMTAARLAIRRGDLSSATRHWKTVVSAEPRSSVGAQAREALEQAMRLHEMAGVVRHPRESGDPVSGASNGR